MLFKLLSCIFLISFTYLFNGVRSQPRIVGGRDVKRGEAPWATSIRILFKDKQQFGAGHNCGGALIKDNTVLTAAHCVHDFEPSEIGVVGGNLLLDDNHETTFIGLAQKFVVHKGYIPVNFTNDIALIILKEAVPADHPFFKKIPLALYNFPVNTKCSITGWGTTRPGLDIYNGKLKYVEIFILNRAKCVKSYGTIPPRTLCAGVPQGGKDACQRDSGGALVCNKLLTGIISHGRGCGLKEFPGIYTNVVQFLEWIGPTGSSPIMATGSWLYIFSLLIIELIHRL